MLNTIIKRIIQAVIIVFCVVLLTFILFRIIPGNPIATLMGEHVNSDTVLRMSSELGLDKPVLIRFFNYLAALITGDLGTSYVLHRSVSSVILEALPNTIILALIAAAISWTLGIFCGIVSAYKENSFIDHIFMGFSLCGVSAPVFLVAMCLQYLFAFKLHLFPISYSSNDYLGFILPAIALAWNSAGSVAHLIRTNILEVMKEKYITTAYSKGMSRFRVIMVHAFKNSILPSLTLMAMQLSSLMSGAIICETIFSINGIGRLSFQAIQMRDLPLLQGTVILCALIIILANLAADCLCIVLDPKIRRKSHLK